MSSSSGEAMVLRGVLQAGIQHAGPNASQTVKLTMIKGQVNSMWAQQAYLLKEVGGLHVDAHGCKDDGELCIVLTCVLHSQPRLTKAVIMMQTSPRQQGPFYLQHMAIPFNSWQAQSPSWPADT